MPHYLYYMKLGDSAQSVPQLLLSVLKILRRTVCLIQLGPQLSPLLWCHLQDSKSHLVLDVLILQGTVGRDVPLLLQLMPGHGLDPLDGTHRLIGRTQVMPP